MEEVRCAGLEKMQGTKGLTTVETDQQEPIPMKVRCTVEEIELDGDSGGIPSVSVTCSRCGHDAESYGTDEASIRRSCAILREECPRKEDNFYVAVQ
jgi:hypothetical protein